MRKYIAFCGTIVLLLVLFMAVALADINITTDITYTIVADENINIADGLTVTLIGSSSTTYVLSIVCGQGVSLTLQNVYVASSTGCALSFTGSGNALILTGDNSLQSAANEPGIRVEDTTSLTISGAGTLTATGGYFSAGIGGGYGSSGGTITISGGTVTATGGYRSAGIGGGLGGNGGIITISGGIVYAEGDLVNAAYDIGPGLNSSSTGTLSISGTAAVFLRNDHCLPATLPVPHTHKTTTDLIAPMQVINGTIYGIAGTGVSPWISATGGYFVLSHIVYDANGGHGNVTNTAQQPTTTATVKPSTGLSRSDYAFTAWNTTSDGSGTDYAPGDPFTLTAPSITLYAQWIWAPVPQTGDIRQRICICSRRWRYCPSPEWLSAFA